MNYLKQKELKENLIQQRCQKDFSILVVRVNVPGEQKKFNWSADIHTVACEMLEKNLLRASIQYERIEEVFSSSYYEHIAFYKILSTPMTVKKLAISMESLEEFGRLLDLDVYDSKGVSVSREDMNLPLRKCYICDEPAFVCGRARKHTTEELHQFMILKAEMLKDKKEVMEGII